MKILLLVMSNYFIASMWEALLHAKILHASKEKRQWFKQLGWIGYLFRRAYLSHELIHHRMTYQLSFYQQFSNQKSQFILDRRLIHYLGKKFTLKIKQNRYGLTINHFWEMIAFLALPLGLNGLIFFLIDRLFFLDKRLIIIVIFISALPLLMSKFIHPLLHQDYSSISKKSKCIQIFYKPLLFLQHYHYLHHTQKYCNFNLCLGGDWILGYRHQRDN